MLYNKWCYYTIRVDWTNFLNHKFTEVTSSSLSYVEDKSFTHPEIIYEKKRRDDFTILYAIFIISNSPLIIAKSCQEKEAFDKGSTRNHSCLFLVLEDRSLQQQFKPRSKVNFHKRSLRFSRPFYALESISFSRNKKKERKGEEKHGRERRRGGKRENKKGEEMIQKWHGQFARSVAESESLGSSTRTRRYSPSFHGESTIVCGG